MLLGPKGAEAAGILKEQLDAQGDSGFSFVDLCADLGSKGVSHLAAAR